VTAGLEPWAADQFIYGILSQDATLMNLLSTAYQSHTIEPGLVPSENVPEIYSDTVPPDVTYPYVVFQMHTPIGDVEIENNIIVMSVMDYLVRVVDRSQSYSAIAPIYGQIHSLLHKATGTVADGVVFNCYRIRPYKMPEIDDAISYRHMGGIYRVQVQS